MNISLLSKVKILMFMKWSYMSPQLCWLLNLDGYHTLSFEIQSFLVYKCFWYPFLQSNHRPLKYKPIGLCHVRWTRGVWAQDGCNVWSRGIWRHSWVLGFGSARAHFRPPLSAFALFFALVALASCVCSLVLVGCLFHQERQELLCIPKLCVFCFPLLLAVLF